MNRWVKISPLRSTPPSPRLGYEGDCVWDSWRGKLIRYGGHNQGGGGEQNSEVWFFDPLSARWSLTRPNVQPPGVCCAQQNIFDSVSGQYIRFPAFSHSHGWQWMREIYLNNTSVWTFEPDSQRWRNMRPYPSPFPQALRCASWDTDLQVLVLFGGEGSSEGTWVYMPSTNTWTKMNPPEEPMFRSAGNMVYDSRHKRHVLFGAQYKDDPHTWTYDLRANRWRDMKPPSMPPTKANDAVLTYDPINGVVLAVIKQSEGEWESARHTISTWAYDLGKNRWKAMAPAVEIDSSSDRCRNIVFAKRWNVALLENRTANHPGDEDGPRGGEQQIWAYRYAQRRDVGSLQPPGDLTIETLADSVRLNWRHAGNSKHSTRPQPSSYVIFRAVGDLPWTSDEKRLAEVPASRNEYVDPDPPKNVCRYRVAAKDSQGHVSDKCQAVTTRPPLIDQLVVSVTAIDRVQLDWTPPKTRKDSGISSSGHRSKSTATRN